MKPANKALANRSFSKGRIDHFLPKSANQWCDLWLDKYSDLLIKKEFPEAQRKQFWTVVHHFLTENPGNPRLISLDKVLAFVNKDPHAHKAPLELFYECSAPSRSHLDCLRVSSLPANPALATPKQNGASTDQEILLIINSTLNLKHRLILQLLQQYGLCLNEIRALKLADVDTKKGCLHIPKTKDHKVRLVMIEPMIIESLTPYCKEFKPQHFLFEDSRKGKPISAKALTEIVSPIARLKRIKV